MAAYLNLSGDYEFVFQLSWLIDPGLTRHQPLLSATKCANVQFHSCGLNLPGLSLSKGLP
jgi:hypothetical protein